MNRHNRLIAECWRALSGVGRRLHSRSSCSLPIFFLLCFFLFSAVRCRADAVPATSPLSSPVRVGIFDNKPMCYLDEDGNPAGIFVDVLEYTARREGWQLQYVQDAWNNLLTKLEQGEIDILLSMALSEERQKTYAFNQTDVFNNWAEVYVLPGRVENWFLPPQAQLICIRPFRLPVPK